MAHFDTPLIPIFNFRKLDLLGFYYRFTTSYLLILRRVKETRKFNKMPRNLFLEYQNSHEISMKNIFSSKIKIEKNKKGR